jgi:DNA-binding transcriptional ArsR family regulator
MIDAEAQKAASGTSGTSANPQKRPDGHTAPRHAYGSEGARTGDLSSRAVWARRNRADILTLRGARGLVPVAIVGVTGLHPRIVGRHLRELVREGLLDSIPTYLDLIPPDGKSRPLHELSGDTRADVLALRRKGLVPLAIADVLDLTDRTIQEHLRELKAAGKIEQVPGFLDLRPAGRQGRKGALELAAVLHFQGSW